MMLHSLGASVVSLQYFDPLAEILVGTKQALEDSANTLVS